MPITAPFITHNTPSLSEASPHNFTAEASTIGLRPGEWPEMIETTLGNSQPLMRRTKRLDADGDLMWVTYYQANGCITLRVFND